VNARNGLIGGAHCRSSGKNSTEQSLFKRAVARLSFFCARPYCTRISRPAE